MDAFLSNWRVSVPAAAAAGGALYMLYAEASFRLKNRGKTLPPVYWEFGCLPIVGAAIPFLIDPLALARRAEKKCGDCFTIKIFGMRITFLSGPDAQENFCKARDDELSQKEAYSFAVPLFGEGVIYDCPLEKRTEQIKTVTNSLHTGALGNYVPQVSADDEQGDKNSPSLGAGGYEIMGCRRTLDAGTCAFSPSIPLITLPLFSFPLSHTHTHANTKSPTHMHSLPLPLPLPLPPSLQMLHELELYFGKLPNKGQIDIYTALSELIILTASNCLMGKEIRNTLHDKVKKPYALNHTRCTTLWARRSGILSAHWRGTEGSDTKFTLQIKWMPKP